MIRLHSGSHYPRGTNYTTPPAASSLPSPPNPKVNTNFLHGPVQMRADTLAMTTLRGVTEMMKYMTNHGLTGHSTAISLFPGLTSAHSSL